MSECKIDKDGVKTWHSKTNGGWHRKDGPAIEYPDGTKFWMYDDQLHRRHGPAVENRDGTKEWWINGERHREDGPAVENSDGTKEWYFHGLFDRGNDEPAREYIDGTKEWYELGHLHREEGPAIIHANGKQEWYLYDEPYLPGEIKCITIAMSPLELPPYILLWILEWSHPDIRNLNQPNLVALLEGIRNSRNRIKGIE